MEYKVDNEIEEEKAEAKSVIEENKETYSIIAFTIVDILELPQITDFPPNPKPGPQIAAITNSDTIRRIEGVEVNPILIPQPRYRNRQTRAILIDPIPVSAISR